MRNEDGNQVVDVVIINWNPHQIVRLPISLFPENIQKKLDGEVYLLAEVNAGTSNVEELYFQNIQVAPELDPESEFA